MKTLVKTKQFVSSSGEVGYICNAAYNYKRSDESGLVQLCGNSMSSSLPYPGFTNVSIDNQRKRLYVNPIRARDAAVYHLITSSGRAQDWAKTLLDRKDFVTVRRRNLDNYLVQDGVRRGVPQVCLVLYRSGTPRTVKLASFDDRTLAFGDYVTVCDDWLDPSEICSVPPTAPRSSGASKCEKRKKRKQRHSRSERRQYAKLQKLNKK
jgi:hypothetical protein